MGDYLIFDIPWLSGLAGSVESKKRVVYLSRLVVHPRYKSGDLLIAAT